MYFQWTWFPCLFRERTMFIVCFSSVFGLWISKTHTLSFQKTYLVFSKYIETFKHILFLYFYRVKTENKHTIHIVCKLSISSSDFWFYPEEFTISGITQVYFYCLSSWFAFTRNENDEIFKQTLWQTWSLQQECFAHYLNSPVSSEQLQTHPVSGWRLVFLREKI